MKQIDNQEYYSSNQYIMFLSKLLEDIRKGNIQIPKFQGPLAWNWEDQLELLRNIRDGIPTGAITIWQTSEQKPECYNYLDPVKELPDHDSRQYLLNGVERLATLLTTLYPTSNADARIDRFQDMNNDSPPGDLEVYFDFDLHDFIRSDNLQPGQKDSVLPLHLVFNSAGMLKFQRQFDDKDPKIEQCDCLGTAFREHKIPMIHIVTENVAMATRTFGVVNRQGRTINEDQMIHALNREQDSDCPEPF